MRNSFVLYTDYSEHIKLLSNEQKGMLFQKIFDYVLGTQITDSDPLIEMAFSFIKTNLDRDQQKYDAIVEKRRNAGSQGGLAKASKCKQKLAKGSKAKQTVANLADTVTDNDTVTDTVYKYIKDDAELDAVFSSFVDMRKKIKKPMTDEAIKLTLNKLETLSKGNRKDKIMILQNSIQGSWQGIYALKENTTKTFEQRSDNLDDRALAKVREELGL